MPNISLKKIAYKCSPTAVLPFIKRIENSDIGSRFSSGAFWSIVGKVVSRLSLLLSLIFVARILGQTEYGKVGIIRSTIGTFMVFALFAMSITTIKFVSQYREVSKPKAGAIIFWAVVAVFGAGGVMTFLLCYFSPFVASRFLEDSTLTPLLRIASFVLFLVALEGVFQGVLAGLEAFKKIALANIISGIISLPCFIILTYQMGVSGAIGGFVIRMVLQVVCLVYLTMRELKTWQIKIAPTYKSECLGILFSFGLPAFIDGLIPSISFWVVNIILVRQAGYEQMAIFDVANQYRAGILTLHSGAGLVILPVLSNLFIHGKDAYSKTVGKVVAINVVLASIIIFVLVALSPWLMLAFGESYKASYWVLIFLGITSGFGIVCDIYKKILASQGKMWRNFIASCVMGGVLILASFHLMQYGALGLAISYAIAFIMFLSILMLFALGKKKFSDADE